VHCEGGFDALELDRLEAGGYDVVRWRRRNLFFGGTNAVEVLPDGTLAAAGDARRGGAGVVVASRIGGELPDPGASEPRFLPGEGGTVAIAGHRTTYGAPFRTIDKLDRGDRIVLKMPYGTLEYRVEKTQVVDNDATWITRAVSRGERLVLSACHPLYSASQRIVAFARLVTARVD
jgi:LPXTG-site transpeptidase (sortase) family protein